MMGFFINYNNVILQLPVNPNSLKITGKMNNKTIQMVGGSELNNIGYKNLKSLSISSFLPAFSGNSYINTNNDFKDPEYYLEFIETIKDNRDYFRLIITELDINMLVSIESFDYSYKYGTDDVDYTLSLKEYKEHNIKVLVANGDDYITVNTVNSVTEETRSSFKTIPNSYIVQADDTLWKIASSILGNGSRWYEIYTYNNNKEIIGGNPNLLKEGLTLSIPN